MAVIAFVVGALGTSYLEYRYGKNFIQYLKDKFSSAKSEL